MEIKYTYREPEDRPIEKAEFRVKKGTTDFTITNRHHSQLIEIAVSFGDKTIFSGFNKDDWNDFTALVNRINRQINGKESRNENHG